MRRSKRLALARISGYGERVWLLNFVLFNLRHLCRRHMPEELVAVPVVRVDLGHCGSRQTHELPA